jgi:neutral trehalase
MKAIVPKDLPEYERKDTRYVEEENRPTDESYDRYVYLANELKKKNYDDELIYTDHPFKIKDKVVSSILYMADKRLKLMAETAGKDTSEIDEWLKMFEQNLTSKLWNAENKFFYDFDLNTNDYIKVKTAGALMPLATGILSKEQVDGVYEHIKSTDFCGDGSCAMELVPSNAINEDTFDHDHYWRGPIWININWFLWKGFKEYEMKDEASHIKRHLLKLMENDSFSEYYSPKTGESEGAKNFSWTAALAIDILFDDL